jgi:hypothetical protein
MRTRTIVGDVIDGGSTSTTRVDLDAAETARAFIDSEERVRSGRIERGWGTVASVRPRGRANDAGR